MSDFEYAGLTALQENVIKTKEHVESVRSALDTAKQNVFQYTAMVSPSADQLNRVVQFVGNTDSTYTHGYFYTCESDGSGGYQWTEIEFGSIGDFLEKVVKLPTATASNVGHTYILIAPQTGYKLGGIYQNHSDGETPPTYSWVLISSSNLTSGNAIDIINDQINVKVDDDTIHIDDTSNEAYVDNAIRKQFIGTQAQWDALSSTEQAKYAIVDITDNIDYTGNIDAVPTQNSPNAVASGGVYSAIQDLNLTDYQKKDLASAVEGATTVEGALGALSSGKVSTDLVPSDASASNKLVTYTAIAVSSSDTITTLLSKVKENQIANVNTSVSAFNARGISISYLLGTLEKFSNGGLQFKGVAQDASNNMYDAVLWFNDATVIMANPDYSYIVARPTSSVTSGSRSPITSGGVYKAIPIMMYPFENGNSIVLSMASTQYRKVCIYNATEYYEFVVHEWGAVIKYHWIIGTELPPRITASYEGYRLTLSSTAQYRIVIEAPDGSDAIARYT